MVTKPATTGRSDDHGPGASSGRSPAKKKGTRPFGQADGQRDVIAVSHKGRSFVISYIIPLICGIVILAVVSPSSSSIRFWTSPGSSFLSSISETLNSSSLGNYTANDYLEVVKMIPSLSKAVFGLVLSTIIQAMPFTRQSTLDYATSEAGNPFIDGWYADPDTEFYDGKHWVFPTSSYKYKEQTYLDAFSSSDLIHWQKHPNVLTIKDISWAKEALWAPAAIERHGKYYLYFAANDIQEGEPEAGLIGGIGVAVADRPEGPYKDAIGKPLIGEYHHGAQPIDQDVFIDDDGQAYIFYGGHSHCNMALLNEDMISIGQFEDGTSYKEITPEGYVEGSQMIKRNGIYYLMWSEGGWTGPNYSVAYGMSTSIMGPFHKAARILQQDAAVAKGSGHNGVIHIKDTDIWYIVYHRRPLSESK